MDASAIEGAAALAAAGFDLVHPFDGRVARWLAHERLALLVGNTRALWEPFCAALRDPALAAELHPLDRYTERTIETWFPGARIVYAHRRYVRDPAGAPRVAVPTVTSSAVPTVASSAVPTTASSAVPTTASSAVPTVASSAVPTVAVPTVAVPTVGSLAVPMGSAVPTTRSSTVPTVGSSAVPTVGSSMLGSPAVANEAVFFPFQQLAVDAGFAAIAPTQLAIHPVHGPWFALRAVVLLDAEPPARQLPIAKPCTCTGACEAAFANARTSCDWRVWLAVRDACSLRGSRYSDEQVEYHYSRATLPGIEATDSQSDSPARS